MGKRILSFGPLYQEVDATCVVTWLEEYFLDYYYATLNEKIKKQIVIFIDLHNELSTFYSYSYSFSNNSCDSAYSYRYSNRYGYARDSEHIKKGKKIADETFDIILPNLLNAYIKLSILLQRENIIN